MLSVEGDERMLKDERVKKKGGGGGVGDDDEVAARLG